MKSFDSIKHVLIQEYLLSLMAGCDSFSKLIYDVNREDSKLIASSLKIDMIPLGKKTMFYKDFEPNDYHEIDEKLDSVISEHSFDLCFRTCFCRLRSSLEKRTRPPNWAVVSALVLSRDDETSANEERLLERVLKVCPNTEELKETAKMINRKGQKNVC